MTDRPRLAVAINPNICEGNAIRRMEQVGLFCQRNQNIGLLGLLRFFRRLVNELGGVVFIDDFLVELGVGRLYDVIEWVAQQPWSDGKIGGIGQSYYAMTRGSWRLRNPRISPVLPLKAVSEHRKRLLAGAPLKQRMPTGVIEPPVSRGRG